MKTSKNNSTPWPVFVISLKRAEDRREAISAQLSEKGINFTFMNAADCTSGVPVHLEERIDRDGTIRNLGYPMSDGEYGCALSHIAAYERIVAEGLPGALILEDDAILTDQLKKFHEAGPYRNHDLVQLSYFDARVWRWKEQKAGPGVTLRFLAENAFTAAGYYLSRKAAIRFMERSLPVRAKADWPFDLKELKPAITVPCLVNHPKPTTEQSYIGDRHQLIPEGFDFSAGYPKGWKRLVSLSAWRRFFMKRFSHRISPGFLD